MTSNEEDITVQTDEALVRFYKSSNPDERQLAHKWLLELQESQQGWQICWKLMQPEKPVESQYFGASLLHFKVSKHWNEIPAEKIPSLRSEIIKSIIVFRTGPNIVLSKLCLALASFGINAISDSEYGVEENVREIQRELIPIMKDDYMLVITEFLAVIPEEFSNVQIPPNKKGIVRKDMESYMPSLLNMLTELLSLPEPANVKYLALKCLGTWVQFGLSVSDCEQLMPLLLNTLKEQDLKDKGADVLVELLTHPTSFRRENGIYDFLSKLSFLEDMLNKSFAESDEEAVSCLCRVLVSLGETHSKILVKAMTDDQQKHSLHLVKLVLQCTNAPGYYPIDETYSQSTFNFWYSLQDEITSLEPEEFTNYHHYFREAYFALIQSLFKKVQYPPEDKYAEFTADDKEQFRWYRQDIQDTIMYIFGILREQCLHYLTELLKYLLSGQSNPSWQEVEAALYLIQGISEYVDVDETTYIRVVISLLPSIPSHPTVADTAVLMVGSYSEWLQCHPDELLSVIPLLQSGLSQAELITPCTLALRDICRECARSEALPHHVALNLGQALTNAVSSSQVKYREKIRCIESIGYIVSALPVAQTQGHMEALVSCMVKDLTEAVKSFQGGSQVRDHLRHCFQYFAALFRSLDPTEELKDQEHPLLPVYKKLLDIIKCLITIDIKDEELVQDITGCINKAVDTVRDPFRVAFTETADILTMLFGKAPFGCILDVSATLIGMFGKDSEISSSVKIYLSYILVTVISFMEGGKASEQPDLIQSLMGLLYRTLKTVPEFLLNLDDPHLKAVQSAMDSLACQETPTIKSACNFFTAYLIAALDHDKAKQLLENIGQELVRRVLLCIGGHAPRPTTDHFAEVLLALNKYNTTQLAVWLHVLLSQDGFPTALVSQMQKEHFEKAVLRQKVNKRRLKEIVKEFSLICRGLYGTAYAS